MRKQELEKEELVNDLRAEMQALKERRDKVVGLKEVINMIRETVSAGYSNCYLT